MALPRCHAGIYFKSISWQQLTQIARFPAHYGKSCCPHAFITTCPGIPHTPCPFYFHFHFHLQQSAANWCDREQNKLRSSQFRAEGLSPNTIPRPYTAATQLYWPREWFTRRYCLVAIPLSYRQDSERLISTDAPWIGHLFVRPTMPRHRYARLSACSRAPPSLSARQTVLQLAAAVDEAISRVLRSKSGFMVNYQHSLLLWPMTSSCLALFPC